MKDVDLSRYPGECALFCQLAASADAMAIQKAFYEQHKDFVLPTCSAFGPVHQKATSIEVVKVDGEQEQIIWTFDVSSEKNAASCKTQFELISHANDVHDIHVSYKPCIHKAELLIDGKVVDTVTAEFLKVYHKLFGQAESRHDAFHDTFMALPFYCDRYNTIVAHGTRSCVVKVYTFQQISMSLRMMSGVIGNKERSLVEYHASCYEQVVPLHVKMPTEERKNDIFIDISREHKELNVTDIFLCVTSFRGSRDVVKEYSLYYGETIVQYGVGSSGIQVDDYTYVYHLRFSTELKMGQPYVFRPFNSLFEQHDAVFSVKINDNAVDSDSKYCVKAFALVATHI